MKNYSELTLTDDYLFSQVMKDESVCKPFLEMLLEIKIAKIEYLQEQKELNLFPDSKGVRLDPNALLPGGDRHRHDDERQRIPGAETCVCHISLPI